jgi:Rrf2 family nitric oxide-sensitive transcriptional repressor
MKLTRFTDYSLRVLIYLGLKTDERVTIREISESFQVSRNHLMKVVSNLTRMGYLNSRRGPGGGITLARSAAEINLADVICDMEEDMNLVTCFSENGECVIKAVCRLKNVLQQALTAYIDELNNYSLQDLLQPDAQLMEILNIPDIRSPQN